MQILSAQPRILVRNLVAAGLIAGSAFGLARFSSPWLSEAQAQTQAQFSAQSPAQSPAQIPVQAPAPAALPNFTSLVQRFGPAVVNITVTQKAQKTAYDPREQLDGDDPFAQFFRGMPFAVPKAPRGGPLMRGLGSGFIVSPDGYIMTNAHVVDGASEVTVRLTDRREYRAKVIGADKKSDIAVIKIDARNLPVVQLARADAVQVGEWVLAIGSPYGFDNTVTSGIVSAKARSLPDETYVPFIQTDVPVNPGNSGGPLFNMNGEVVGINSQIYSQTGGYQGLSFAIPIDIAVKVKDELIAHGKVTRGRIGVTIQDVNQQLANSFGLPRPMGALVSEVESDGPGASAGLKSGDIITRIDGREVDRSADLPAQIAQLKPGSHAQLEVWRGGKASNLGITIGELNDGNAIAKAGPSQEHGRLGLAVRPLDPREKAQVGASGLLVEDVSGPAQAAGIQPGDVILAVNGTPVRSAEQLRDLTKKAGDSMAVLIQRDDAKIFVPIALG